MDLNNLNTEFKSEIPDLRVHSIISPQILKEPILKEQNNSNGNIVIKNNEVWQELKEYIKLDELSVHKSEHSFKHLGMDIGYQIWLPDDCDIDSVIFEVYGGHVVTQYDYKEPTVTTFQRLLTHNKKAFVKIILPDEIYMNDEFWNKHQFCYTKDHFDIFMECIKATIDNLSKINIKVEDEKDKAINNALEKLNTLPRYLEGFSFGGTVVGYLANNNDYKDLFDGYIIGASQFYRLLEKPLNSIDSSYDLSTFKFDENFSFLEKAKNISKPILIIHNTDDRRVLMQYSIDFIKYMQKHHPENKELIHFFPLTNGNHLLSIDESNKVAEKIYHFIKKINNKDLTEPEILTKRRVFESEILSTSIYPDSNHYGVSTNNKSPFEEPYLNKYHHPYIKFPNEKGIILKEAYKKYKEFIKLEKVMDSFKPVKDFLRITINNILNPLAPINDHFNYFIDETWLAAESSNPIIFLPDLIFGLKKIAKLKDPKVIKENVLNKIREKLKFLENNKDAIRYVSQMIYGIKLYKNHKLIDNYETLTNELFAKLEKERKVNDDIMNKMSEIKQLKTSNIILNNQEKLLDEFFDIMKKSDDESAESLKNLYDKWHISNGLFSGGFDIFFDEIIKEDNWIFEKNEHNKDLNEDDFKKYLNEFASSCSKKVIIENFRNIIKEKTKINSLCIYNLLKKNHLKNNKQTQQLKNTKL